MQYLTMRQLPGNNNHAAESNAKNQGLFVYPFLYTAPIKSWTPTDCVNGCGLSHQTSNAPAIIVPIH